jgi:NADH:ubiquinone oxidoreductase subunit E
MAPVNEKEEKIVKDSEKDYGPEIINIVKLNINKSGAPIRILQQTQELVGYLPLSALNTISRETNIPLAKLFSIITFYHYFSLYPHGRHIIQVCKGTACYVKGGQKILDYLKREYNLEPGGTTGDRKFSLNMVRCLGCCGLSPVMAVGNDVYRTVKTSQLKEILGYYK